MFEGLLETNRKRIEKSKIIFLPIVVIIQGLILGSFVVSSVWSVSYIDEPPLIIKVYSSEIIPPPVNGKKANVVGKEGENKGKINTGAPVKIPESIVIEPVNNSERKIVEGVVGGIDDFNGNDNGLVGEIPGGIPPGTKVELPQGPVKDFSKFAKGESPQIIYKVQPEYPEIARKARIEGLVVLEAIIEIDGSIGEIKILTSLNPLLDQAAIKAVKQWKFEPGKINGKPVKSSIILKIIFRIS